MVPVLELRPQLRDLALYFVRLDGPQQLARQHAQAVADLRVELALAHPAERVGQRRRHLGDRAQRQVGRPRRQHRRLPAARPAARPAGAPVLGRRLGVVEAA
jgi:hypothetical protein